jgi:AraC-like DNA-binding protein
MKRYVQTKQFVSHPQAASIIHDSINYTPNVLHATIDQTHPIGHKQTFTRHKHDFYHIVLYTSGYGEYSIEGRFYPAQPGTCVLIHPGQYHDFVSRWKQSVYSEITFVYLSPENKFLNISFEKLLSLHTGLKTSLEPHYNLSMDQVHTLKNLLAKSISHLNGAGSHSHYFAHFDLVTIYNFFAQIAASHIREPLKQSRFERSGRYIEDQYFEKISIDELAKVAGVSNGYFFRGFKKEFGISPLAYQQNIRIEAAKTLLKTTTLRCNEIAWQVGFSDVYFFHRIFKKHTGQTPLQFRKS